MFKKLKAFTLAEALIVIAIIGVISAVAFPIVKTKVEIKGFEAALKKNYFILQAVLDKYENENYVRLTSNSNSAIIKKALVSNLEVFKDCTASDEGIGVCAGPSGYQSYTQTATYKANELLYSEGQFALNDGTLLMISKGVNYYNVRPITIFIDVNGYQKGPNRLGLDTYALQLLSDGRLLPLGDIGTSQQYSEHCSKTDGSTQSGLTCAYEVIRKDRKY